MYRNTVGCSLCSHLSRRHLLNPPPRVFSIRGLRLYFPALEPWVAWSASLPRQSSWLSNHECGAAGSATHRSACPILCHSESSPLGVSVCNCRAAGSASGQTACPVCPTLCQSLGPAPATRVLSASPISLDECLFFISLVSDFLTIRFSVSSGCARRRSVSTYAAILVLRNLYFFCLPELFSFIEIKIL